MISIHDVLLLHELSVKDFGGARGIRDTGGLDSAINRPFQTFEGNDLYPSPIDKATALCESLIVNHPFADGNKRTGMLAMIGLLKEYQIEVTATENELYDLIISISTGELKFEGIVEWLRKNTESH